MRTKADVSVLCHLIPVRAMKKKPDSPFQIDLNKKNRRKGRWVPQQAAAVLPVAKPIAPKQVFISSRLTNQADPPAPADPPDAIRFNSGSVNSGLEFVRTRNGPGLRDDILLGGCGRGDPVRNIVDKPAGMISSLVVAETRAVGSPVGLGAPPGEGRTGPWRTLLRNLDPLPKPDLAVVRDRAGVVDEDASRRDDVLLTRSKPPGEEAQGRQVGVGETGWVVLRMMEGSRFKGGANFRLEQAIGTADAREGDRTSGEGGIANTEGGSETGETGELSVKQGRALDEEAFGRVGWTAGLVTVD